MTGEARKKVHHVVLVTGSRRWTNRTRVRKVLSQYPPGTFLIHGAAKGLDLMAAEMGEELGFQLITMPYLKKLGRAGGQVRNKYMLSVAVALSEAGHQLSVHAFPLEGGTGTQGMMDRCETLEVEVTNHGTR